MISSFSLSLPTLLLLYGISSLSEVFNGGCYCFHIVVRTYPTPGLLFLTNSLPTLVHARLLLFPPFFLFFLCYIIDVRFPLHDLSHRYIPFVLHTANVSCHLGLDWIHLTVQTQTDTQRYTPHHIPIYIYPTHIPTSNVPRFPSRSFYPLNPRMIPASLRSFVVKLALYSPPVVALGLQQHLLLNVYIRA